MFATRKKTKLSREAMLDSRPTRNDLLEWEKSDDGEVQVVVTRQESWKIRMLSKLFYIPKQRRITLDELGSEVWHMCNGSTTVAQMIESLSGKYQLNRKEAEVSLLNYLKTLGEKRFIGFALEPSGEKQSRKDGASGKKWV